MSATTRRWLLIGLVVFVVFWVFAATVRAETTSKIRFDGAVVVRTWERDFNVCPRYNNGVLAGWSVRHRETGFAGAWWYTFGYWDGSFCSNGRHVWNVNWGGEPPGSASGLLGWRYDHDYTRIVDQDNRGDIRHRTWRAHFHQGALPIGPHDYPWLRVVIGTNNYINTSHGCGC